jgi:tRNA 5-methylaminomethyl-2-thiouridine biosynthesis bifunctional protein
MTDSYFVDPAELAWHDDAPFSETYQDIYWSGHDGSPLSEKQAVFVDPVRAMARQCKPGSQMTVCELGFGFGINCLLTADMWRDLPPDCRLNFISIEKHPVRKQDLAQLLSKFEFSSGESLLAQYPPHYRGQHVIWLSSNVRLLLIFEDIDDALGNLDAEVDMWFLDGFAPSKNEAMWQPAIYRKMFARSHPGAEVTTYSAAGGVRRGLEYAGFATRKINGFGRKKEMLSAKRPGNWQPSQSRRDSITIIGAGLAGIFCAEALTRRGIEFQIIDGGDPGPSTIPQLAVMPQLALASEPRYRFSFAACHYMQSAPGYYKTGVHRWGQDDEEIIRLRQIAEQFPDEIIESLDDRVVMHEAGWLAFEETKRSITRQLTHAQIGSIRHDGQWQCLQGDEVISSSDHLILATGFNRELLPDELEVRAIGGHAVSVKTDNLAQLINNDVTVFPTYQGRSIISGTYERDASASVNWSLISELVEAAAKLVEFDGSSAEPWHGIRAAARDRFPIVGQAPDWQKLHEFNRLSAINEFQDGLYYCTAFGSRGATHARLAAEHLVSKMLREPAALGLKEQRLMSPARFAIRNRKPDE